MGRVWFIYRKMELRYWLVGGNVKNNPQFLDSVQRRANARNVSFRISLRWPIHIINPVDKTELDRNIAARNMLHAFGQPVATCCDKVRIPRRNIEARTWPNDYNIMQHSQMSHEKFSNLTQQHPTCRNTLQQGGQTHTTCCA